MNTTKCQRIKQKFGKVMRMFERLLESIFTWYLLQVWIP